LNESAFLNRQRRGEEDRASRSLPNKEKHYRIGPPSGGTVGKKRSGDYLNEKKDLPVSEAATRQKEGGVRERDPKTTTRMLMDRKLSSTRKEGLWAAARKSTIKKRAANAAPCRVDQDETESYFNNAKGLLSGQRGLSTGKKEHHQPGTNDGQSKQLPNHRVVCRIPIPVK